MPCVDLCLGRLPPDGQFFVTDLKYVDCAGHLNTLLFKLGHLHLNFEHVVLVGGHEVRLVLLDNGGVKCVELVEHVVDLFVGLNYFGLVVLRVLPERLFDFFHFLH